MTVTVEPGPHPLLIDPEGHLDALATALAEPGADRAVRLRDELLAPLAAADLATVEVGTAWRLVRAVRALWSRVEVPAGLEPAWALLAEATRSGSPEEIGELATRLAAIGPEVWLTWVEPVAGGGVELGYHATLALDPDLVGVPPVGAGRAGVVIRHREHGGEWRLAGGKPARVEGSGLVWRGRAVLDAETAADGAPLMPGIWDAYVRVEALGLTRDVRLGSRRLEPRGGLAALPIVVRPDGRIDQLYSTAYDNLSLTVRAQQRWLVAALADGEIDVSETGVRYRTRVRWAGPQPDLRLDLQRVGSGRRTHQLRATDGSQWVARPHRGHLWLSRGTHHATVRVTSTRAAGAEPIEVPGTLVVDRAAQQRWLRAAVTSSVAAAVRRARRTRRRR